MKWPFLSRFNTNKKRADKVDVKKTRKRYTKAQLIDLFCTVRASRSVTQDTTSYLNLSSSNDDPVSQPSDLGGSLSDLVFYHSLVLREPIPTSSMRVGCTNTQPGFCPTCRDVVIPLPQKRRSRLADMERDQPAGAKRIRACLDELELAHMRWQQTDERTVSRGYFNPTYATYKPDDSGSVYSDVYDSTCSESSSSSSIADRPKLIGVRRRNSEFRGSTHGILQEWLLTTKQVELDSTYATVYEEDEQLISFDEQRLFEPIGDPCSSSTLKRRRREILHEDDDVTLYDDVASEIGTSFGGLNPELSRSQPPNLRRRLSMSPESPINEVKRVRREFFVCEE